MGERKSKVENINQERKKEGNKRTFQNKKLCCFLLLTRVQKISRVTRKDVHYIHHCPHNLTLTTVLSHCTQYWWHPIVSLGSLPNQGHKEQGLWLNWELVNSRQKGGRQGGEVERSKRGSAQTEQCYAVGEAFYDIRTIGTDSCSQLPKHRLCRFLVILYETIWIQLRTISKDLRTF